MFAGFESERNVRKGGEQPGAKLYRKAPHLRTFALLLKHDLRVLNAGINRQFGLVNLLFVLKRLRNFSSVEGLTRCRGETFREGFAGEQIKRPATSQRAAEWRSAGCGGGD